MSSPGIKTLGLRELIAVLHREIDVADERNQLALTLHKTTAYELLDQLYALDATKAKKGVNE